MNSPHPKASIVILDFKKAKRVCENVESILRQEVDFPVQVIVADNSCDAQNAQQLQTLAKHPNVTLQINPGNLGYPRGNNGAAQLAQGEYLLIVNPDIIWREKDTLQKLVDFMEKHPEAGICGPQQINDGDGSIAMTIRAFPKLFLQTARRTWLRRLPLIRRWVAYDEMRHLDYSRTQSVDWLQSSFWIIRKKLWDELGGLNSDYFLFMTDPDLCWRTWEKGYQVVYCPEATVYADGIRLSAGGMREFFKKWTMRQHLKDSLRYQWNYFFKGNPRRLWEQKKGSA